ncbi:HalD/BesD family halogenase [Amycolatopsis sacchari]|uniref:HalD/BesD family halogenase n=1 Tax=Amycolatopsis sacchari TaxID=115433 RepID=UPI003EBC8AE5
MNTRTATKALSDHLATTFTESDVQRRADVFSRDGFVKFGADQPLVPAELLRAVDDEVSRLVEEHTERRDLQLRTTGGTPRKMSVVRSEQIEKASELISRLAASEELLGFMARVAREPVIASVTDDERFLITHQEHKGDTHGWHWGDYSFALIWALRMPPLRAGGMLQCVPHTHWDKTDPRINETLCERKIDTHGLVSGDIYFLRTDTTLHRTVPLTEDGQRTILNMTWAGQRDLRKSLEGDDRWWEDASASAAEAVGRDER